MIRVMIVDDHDGVRSGLAILLGAHPDMTLVGEAASSAEAIALIVSAQPDVIIMDLYMPDGDGASTTLAVKALDPAVTVIILSNSMNGEHLNAAIKAGASTYLPKYASSDQLIRAIREANAA